MKHLETPIYRQTTLPLKTQHKVVPSVIAACLGIFVAYLPITLVSTVLTLIGQRLSAPLSGLQWVQAASAMAMAIIILPAGTYSELLGRKKVYLSALALLAGGSLVSFTTTTIEGLWLGQFIMGLGAGALLPSTLALLSAAVPDPRRRLPLIGIWASCLSLGLLLGPFAAGGTLQSGDWHMAFLPLIVLALLILPWAACFVPESRSYYKRSLDLPGQITVALGTAALIFGVIEGPIQGWGALPVISSFIVTAGSFLLFLIVELKSRSPLLHPGLFRMPAFATTSLVALLAMFALIGTNFILSLFFGLVQQLNPQEIALRFLILNGVTILIGPLVGAIQQRISARWLLTLGLVLAGAVLLSMSMLTPEASFVDISWRLALLAVGFGLILTPMTATAVAAVPPQFVGMASTTNNALLQIGTALGPAALGSILSSGALQHLTALLKAHRVPVAVHDHVLTIAQTQGLGTARDLSFGPYTHQVHTAIGHAFTLSMHTATTISGSILLLASVITLLFLRLPVPSTRKETNTF